MKPEPAMRFGFSLLTATALVFLTQAASAATVSLKVGTIEGSGPAVEMPISTGPCEGLGALQFDLTYDSTIVAPESVEAGSALPNGLVEFQVKAPGRLGIALISSAPVNGSGDLLKVRFQPLATAGSSTALTITKEIAWDYKDHHEMLVATEAGSLRLTAGASKSARLPLGGMRIPLVTGGIVLLALILIARARRKRGSGASAPAASAPDTGRPATGGFCQKCGARHDAEARFCPRCGHAIDSPA